MRQAFLDALSAEGTLPGERIAEIRDLLRAGPEPIGAIAYSYGMITGADIDIILDEQRVSRRRFGEIAVSLGILEEEQVVVLLRIQQLRAASEIAEALSLSGVCSFDDAVSHLGRFLARTPEKCLG